MTSAITYKNTKTAIPGWVPTIHVSNGRGFAYETDTHFVHVYGRDGGLFVLSKGLTASEAKAGTLTEWVERVFGATDIQPMKLDVGSSVAGVWRPGPYYIDEVAEALQYTEGDLRSGQQGLRLLIDRLDELLQYVEPVGAGLNSHSHKTRELLILACTEVENSWQHYMRASGSTPTGRDFTTKEYVKLLPALFLEDWEVTLRPYNSVAPMRPFQGWDAAAPTQSLPWYDAYNKTKHNRSTYFHEASLGRCIAAVAANIILFCVRFGPFHFTDRTGKLSPLVDHLFSLRLVNCDPTEFYVPLLTPTPNIRRDLFCGKFECWGPWSSRALTL